MWVTELPVTMKIRISDGIQRKKDLESVVTLGPVNDTDGQLSRPANIQERKTEKTRRYKRLKILCTTPTCEESSAMHTACNTRANIPAMFPRLHTHTCSCIHTNMHAHTNAPPQTHMHTHWKLVANIQCNIDVDMVYLIKCIFFIDIKNESTWIVHFGRSSVQRLNQENTHRLEWATETGSCRGRALLSSCSWKWSGCLS